MFICSSKYWKEVRFLNKLSQKINEDKNLSGFWAYSHLLQIFWSLWKELEDAWRMAFPSLEKFFLARDLTLDAHLSCSVTAMPMSNHGPCCLDMHPDLRTSVPTHPWPVPWQSLDRGTGLGHTAPKLWPHGETCSPRESLIHAESWLKFAFHQKKRNCIVQRRG